MIYIVTSEHDSHRDIVEHFESRGARHLTTDARRTTHGEVIVGKSAILRSMLAARVWRLRRLIGPDDRVVVYGWHAIPLLALMKLRLIARPARLVVTGLFIQSDSTRRVVHRILRALLFDQVRFIAYTPREVEHLAAGTGVDRTRISLQRWRLELGGRAPASAIRDDGSVFSGGYSNRDYDTLLRAVRSIDVPVVIAASRRNAIDADAPPNVSFHFDIPEAQFELLLAGCRVAVIPLKDSSDDAGSGVLLRVLRNGKPLIATRHDSSVGYLGADYPGFVDVGDADALERLIRRATTDAAFRARLTLAVTQAQARLDALDAPGVEVYAVATA